MHGSESLNMPGPQCASRRGLISCQWIVCFSRVLSHVVACLHQRLTAACLLRRAVLAQGFS